MERGIYPQFSRDGARIRWIEHAANPFAVGDLYSASVPGGQPGRPPRNVRIFSEYKDGRVLAVANYAYPGTQNRVIVIDEDARVAQWVADSAFSYRQVRGSNDVL